MIIKKYKLFLESRYPFGCAMIKVNIDNWNEIVSEISPYDIYRYYSDIFGIQKNPHLSLLYGLHSEVSKSDVESCLTGISKINIEVDGLDFFKGKFKDILILRVKNNEKINSIYNCLSKLPNSDRIANYTPHITIAYLKPGRAQKYTDEKSPFYLGDFNFEIDNIKEVYYSTNTGKEFKINLS